LMKSRALPLDLSGPRPARSEERAPLLKMVNFIFRTAAGRDPTIATDWEHVYAPTNLENVLVVAEGEKLLASAAIWANWVRLGDTRLQVGGINCVGTLPEHRRYGLAGHLLEATHRRMQELGCHVGLLHTNIINYYRRFGWERAGITHTYRFDRGNIGLLPQLPAQTRAHFAGPEAVIDALAALRNGDNLGGERTPEHFAQLIRARGKPRPYVAESSGKIVAYLLLQDNIVMEWAGPAADVAGLVRACYTEIDDPAATTSREGRTSSPIAYQELQLSAPIRGHALVALLDNLRIPFHVQYAGMIYVVDPAALLQAFGCDRVTVAEEGEGFKLSYAGQHETFDRCQLAKLFFGPERITDFGADIFPFPFWQWPIERV
jgi:ribosomal protein S18 acetylase RimI-like enzyme